MSPYVYRVSNSYQKYLFIHVLFWKGHITSSLIYGRPMLEGIFAYKNDLSDPLIALAHLSWEKVSCRSCSFSKSPCHHLPGHEYFLRSLNLSQGYAYNGIVEISEVQQKEIRSSDICRNHITEGRIYLYSQYYCTINTSPPPLHHQWLILLELLYHLYFLSSTTLPLVKPPSYTVPPIRPLLQCTRTG